MKKAPFFVLLLASITLTVSGCTATVEVTEKGVEIESFSADFSSVYSGENVRFSMLVRNTGTSDAAHVFTEVLGIDQSWGPNPGQEKLPNEQECRYSGSHFSLLAPEPDNGVPGQAHQCTWNYEAPSLSAGQSITYDVTARVFYRYSSITTTILTFGSYDEIRELQNSGQPLPSETTVSSQGPIRITIDTTGPIRFSEDEDEVGLTLYVTVENIGGGTVCSAENPNDCKPYPGDGVEKQNKVKIEFPAASNMVFSEECGREITVWSGSSNSYSCEAKATGLQNQAMTQRTIAASSAYSYYTDKEISVTVSGY